MQASQDRANNQGNREGIRPVKFLIEADDFRGILNRQKTENMGSKEKLRADEVWSLETTLGKFGFILYKRMNWEYIYV